MDLIFTGNDELAIRLSDCDAIDVERAIDQGGWRAEQFDSIGSERRVKRAIEVEADQRAGSEARLKGGLSRDDRFSVGFDQDRVSSQFDDHLAIDRLTDGHHNDSADTESVVQQTILSITDQRQPSADSVAAHY